MATKKIILIAAIAILSSIYAKANFQDAFDIGEKLTYKLYYKSAITGSVTAGVMTSEVLKPSAGNSNKSTLHFRLKGKTKGAFRWFFAANDEYQSYVDKSSMLPFFYTERIKEGGYTCSKDVTFKQNIGLINTLNNKNDDKRTYNTNYNVQDLLSSFYYMRNWDYSKIESNTKYHINMFMDDSVYQIEFEYFGNEVIKTSLGGINCMVLKPKVLKGGVFADETPLTIYVSADDNHLPIMAESKLTIGKARIELIEHKGLKHPFIASK